MTKDGFLQLLRLLSELSPKQKQQLLRHVAGGGEQPEIVQFLEQRLAESPHCPHCHHEGVPHRWGTHNGLQRYRCRECKGTYTAITGTPLQRLKKRDKWMLYFETMLDSMPLRKAAKRCGISLDTSFRWRHRFLRLVDNFNAESLAGVVELDETYFRESFKGKRDLSCRKPRRRGNDHRDEVVLVPVMVARDRNKAVADFVMPSMAVAEVEQRLMKRIHNDVVLCTDGHLSYEVFARRHSINHKVLNASRGIRVVEKSFHIQGVNAYHKRLKTWIARFHGVATKYMHRYLGWFRWFELNGPNKFDTPIELATSCALGRRPVLQAAPA